MATAMVMILMCFAMYLPAYIDVCVHIRTDMYSKGGARCTVFVVPPERRQRDSHLADLA